MISRHSRGVRLCLRCPRWDISSAATATIRKRGYARLPDEFRKRKIPADILYLDIDYQEKNRPFTVDRERFPTSNRW